MEDVLFVDQKIAEAEAREASATTAIQRGKPLACTCCDQPCTCHAPTAAEVIAAAEEALRGMAWFLDAGVQESSMAPRCCAVCGKVQIDGQHEHHKSCHAMDIKSALALIARYKEAHGETTAR